MNILIDRISFSKALAVCTALQQGRSTFKHHKQVFVVGGEVCRMIATDGDNYLDLALPGTNACDYPARSQACLSQDYCRKLKALLKATDADLIRLDLPDCAAEYLPDSPLESPAERQTIGEIDGMEFVKGLEACLISVDEEATRYALSGVCLDANQHAGTIDLVATDCRQLSHFPLQRHKSETCQMTGLAIIPTKAAKLVAKLATSYGANGIKLQAQGMRTDEGEFIPTAVTWECPQLRLVARLCQGRFPRWREVFPKATPDNLATVDNGRLSAFLKEASLWIDGIEERGVSFGFGEQVILATTSTCKHYQTLPAKIRWQHDDTKQGFIHLDIARLAELLKPMQADITISAYASGICVLQDDNLRCVLMGLSYDKEPQAQQEKRCALLGQYRQQTASVA